MNSRHFSNAWYCLDRLAMAKPWARLDDSRSFLFTPLWEGDMLLQPPNPLEKRAVKLVIKPKESRFFVAEMVRLKKPIERTILAKSIACSTGGKNYFDQFKCSNVGRQKAWDLHT